MPIFLATFSERAARARFAGVACAVLLALCAAGCGKRGMPRAPEPRGPHAPDKIVLRQLGNGALLRFEMPQLRGPNPAQQPVSAELLRVDFPGGFPESADEDTFRRRGVSVATREVEGRQPGEAVYFEDTGWSELEEGGVGRSLRYAVRLYDRRGRPSPLAFSIDLSPQAVLPAPTELAAEPTMDGVRLTWKQPPTEDPLRVNLYRGAADAERFEVPLNVEPLAGTEYLDVTAKTGEAYRYTARVVLTPGRPWREGSPGEVVDILVVDHFAPAQVEGLVAVQEGAAVRLFWNPNHERDLAGYRLYRQSREGGWRRIGSAPLVQPSFLDKDIRTGQKLSYRVSAIDGADPPNEGQSSATVAVDVAAEPQAEAP